MSHVILYKISSFQEYVYLIKKLKINTVWMSKFYYSNYYINYEFLIFYIHIPII